MRLYMYKGPVWTEFLGRRKVTCVDILKGDLKNRNTEKQFLKETKERRFKGRWCF